MCNPARVMADQPAQANMYSPAPAAPVEVPLEEARNVNLVRQIEWYLGRTNLNRDFYLKREMDENLWVSLSSIMKFPKMVKLNITENEEAHLAQLLSTRSGTVEVDQTGRMIRPIWAVRSTLEMSGIPPNVSPVAIQSFLEALADSSFPAWVHIYEDGQVWKVVFSSFEGADIAAPKVNGKVFNGTPVTAAVKQENRISMIGDAASLLDGNRAVYTPPGTPTAFYQAGTDMMQSAVGGPSPGAPHSGQGQQMPVHQQGPYANVNQAMMPLNIGVQGLPQGYGFIPNTGYNSPGFQGNGVAPPMMQRGFNGHSGYYNPYSGAPFDAAHPHPMQHRSQPDSPTTNDAARLQQQMAAVQLPGSEAAPAHGVRSPGAGGASGPRPQNTIRRPMGRGAGQQQPLAGGAMVMNPQEGIGIAPGAMNMAQIPQGAIRMGPDGVPIDSKGTPMAFVGMAHPMPNPRQPTLVMLQPGQHPQHPHGNTGGAGNDHQMRGPYPPGGRPRNQQHQHHHNSGGQIRDGGGPRGHNTMGPDVRGPHQGKKNKKAGRHNQRPGGPHNDKADFDARRDQRVEGGGAGGPSRDERRPSIEKKKVEPNLATMNFPPLPGATSEGEGGPPAQGATKETPKESSKEAPKEAPKETPIQSESESNVTVSPDQAPAKSGSNEKLMKEQLTEKALPQPVRGASGNGLEKSLETATAGASIPALNPIAEDGLSTASSSGGSDSGATGPSKERPISQLSYAAALRKRAAANLAKQGTIPPRNATSSPGLPRGSGSKPSSPVLAAASAPPGAGSGEMARRSVIATSNPVKPGGGGSDEAKGSQSDGASKDSPTRPVLPANMSNNVWANKPRSLFEPASSAPVAKLPRSPAGSSAKSGSPAQKPVEPSEAMAATIPEQKLAGKGEGSPKPAKAGNGTGAPFLTEKISNEAAAAAAAASNAAAAGASASPAKGAWATGAPKAWGTKEQSGGKNES